MQFVWQNNHSTFWYSCYVKLNWLSLWAKRNDCNVRREKFQIKRGLNLAVKKIQRQKAFSTFTTNNNRLSKNRKHIWVGYQLNRRAESTHRRTSPMRSKNPSANSPLNLSIRSPAALKMVCMHSAATTNQPRNIGKRWSF